MPEHENIALMICLLVTLATLTSTAPSVPVEHRDSSDHQDGASAPASTAVQLTNSSRSFGAKSFQKASVSSVSSL